MKREEKDNFYIKIQQQMKGNFKAKLVLVIEMTTRSDSLTSATQIDSCQIARPCHKVSWALTNRQQSPNYIDHSRF